MFKKILVGHDGSRGAAKALTAAVDLACVHKAELHVILVEELPRLPTTIDEVVEEQNDASLRLGAVIQAAKEEALSRQVRLDAHLVAGHPVSAIVEFIERTGPDLLVVGFMGHSALYNRLIGSTTDRLVELAPIPVLVIK